MNPSPLKLFIAGPTSRSRRAISSLSQLCDQELQGHYQLVVIDVLERPDLAEADKILATPTVVRTYPPPEQRIIGDLSEPERVLAALELESLPSTTAVSPAHSGDL